MQIDYNFLNAELMPDLIPVLKKTEIEQVVTSVAMKISSDYEGREPVLVGVLKGAFIFLSDLVRHLTIPVKIDFIRVSSYGSGDVSSGSIRLTKGIEIDIADKDLLIVEDIVDSGLTLKYITDYLLSFSPKTVRICTLIDKYERREAEIRIDYIGQTVKKGFLVGYGLDYAEGYRNLPDIYHLKL